MFFKEASFKLLPTAIKLLMLTYSFFHFMISFKQSELMCSSILLKGRSTPQRSWQGTILNSHFSALWELSSLRSIMPQVSLLEHFTCWKFHLFKCLMRSPFLITFVHFSLMHLMLNSFTSLRIGILGIISFLLKLLLHNGHSQLLISEEFTYLFCSSFFLLAITMHFSQNKLCQHGDSTASSKISRQIGHTHRSSLRLLAERQVNLIFLMMSDVLSFILLSSFDFFRFSTFCIIEPLGDPVGFFVSSTSQKSLSHGSARVALVHVRP